MTRADAGIVEIHTFCKNPSDEFVGLTSARHRYGFWWFESQLEPRFTTIEQGSETIGVGHIGGPIDHTIFRQFNAVLELGVAIDDSFQRAASL